MRIPPPNQDNDDPAEVMREITQNAEERVAAIKRRVRGELGNKEGEAETPR